MQQSEATKRLIATASEVLTMLQTDELHGPGRNTGVVGRLSEALTEARRDAERPAKPVPDPEPEPVEEPVLDRPRHLDELPLHFPAYERECLVRALRENDGNRLAAAFALTISKSSLYRKIQQHGLQNL